MLKVEGVKTKKDVTFMTNPKAEYVSLVGHAANRTPFKVLKADDVEKAVGGARNLPINKRSSWDGAGARKRIAKWAGGPDKDKIDWGKYAKGFAWYDAANKENFGSYKLPFADVINGTLTATWGGVSNAMGALMGSRGGVDIPAKDRKGVYNLLKSYYKKFEKEAPEFKEEGGDDMGVMVVQSILVPEGESLEELAEKEDLAWLSDARTDVKKEYEGYTKLFQRKADEFIPSSLRMVRLSPAGTFAIVGKLKDASKADGALTVGEDLVEKIGQVLSSPMTEVIETEVPAQGVALSFRDMFERELTSFLDIVYGALNQTGADPKARKKTIMSAVDAFKSFLSMALDAVGKEELSVGFLKLVSTDSQEEDGMFEFKTEEEFASKVKEIVAEVIKEANSEKGDDKAKNKSKEPVGDKVEKGSDVEKKDKAGVDKDSVPDGSTDLAKVVSDLVSTVKELVKKQEELENQLDTEPGAVEKDDDAEVQYGKKAKKSVFAGLLTAAH